MHSTKKIVSKRKKKVYGQVLNIYLANMQDMMKSDSWSYMVVR